MKNWLHQIDQSEKALLGRIVALIRAHSSYAIDTTATIAELPAWRVAGGIGKVVEFGLE